MNTLNFSKFHGFGNDYIVIEGSSLTAGTDLSTLAAAICDRHTGAGADGIAVLERLDGVDADYNCEIVNPDGSIAGFSGNGTRCAVAFLHHSGNWEADDLRQQAEAEARQKREIETVQAREQAETSRVREEQRLISENARLQSDELIQIREQEQLRQVEDELGIADLDAQAAAVEADPSEDEAAVDQA